MFSHANDWSGAFLDSGHFSCQYITQYHKLLESYTKVKNIQHNKSVSLRSAIVRQLVYLLQKANWINRAKLETFI